MESITEIQQLIKSKPKMTKEKKAKKSKQEYNKKYRETHADLKDKVLCHCIYCDLDIKYFNKKHFVGARHIQRKERHDNLRKNNKLSKKILEEFDKFENDLELIL